MFMEDFIKDTLKYSSSMYLCSDDKLITEMPMCTVENCLAVARCIVENDDFITHVI